tara:strand:- start:3305 stop:3772 length:468 start_codon:yes stop_codon:yes gene_type:complete
MRKLSKKAELTLEKMARIGLAIFLASAIIYMSMPFLRSLWQTSKSYSVEERLKICMRYGELGEYPDTSDKNNEGKPDGLPDICDNCPFTYGKPVIEDGRISFDEKIDADRDLFVKGCKGNDGTGKTPTPVKEENDEDREEHPKYLWKLDQPEETG